MGAIISYKNTIVSVENYLERIYDSDALKFTFFMRAYFII